MVDDVIVMLVYGVMIQAVTLGAASRTSIY